MTKKDENKRIIPIKNLFYMLCYAWNVLAIMDDIKVGTDDYDDAYNLLARVFSFGVGKLIRSGFHRSYIEETEELSTLRGKINVQESINHLSQQRKKLVCSYDEYSANDIFNQIIKYTISALLRSPDIDKTIKTDLRKQVQFFHGIDETAPTKNNRQKLVFNRNNVTYKLLIHIAVMLYDNTSINEEDGNTVFKDFFRQEQMCKVFELFILNFYTMHLPRHTYKVHAPKITWHLDTNAAEEWGDLFEVEGTPGDRRTDIVVENNALHTQFIMDAKYYHKTFVDAYMNSEDERVRTGHLNQVRGYLIDSDYPGKKFGALIYPMVNNELKKGKMYPILGTPIIVKTINLNDDWKNIEADMLEFVHKVEKPNKKSS